MQLIDWLGESQLKSPRDRVDLEPGVDGVRDDQVVGVGEPGVVTLIVNVCEAPPAVTVAESNVLVSESWTSSSIVVVAASLVSLPLFGSTVPSLVTFAVFERTVPLSSVESAVTWTVKALSPPAASRSCSSR